MTRTITTDRRSGLTIGDLLGDGSNGARRQRAAAGRDDPEHRACPLRCQASARSTSARSAARYAEWPLVEICARAVIKDGTFQFVRLAAGGIAPVPLRLAAAEAALQGKPANAATIADAAERKRHQAQSRCR